MLTRPQDKLRSYISSNKKILYLKYIWILTRQKKIDPAIVTRLKNMLVAGGYEINDFALTDQTCSN